MTNEIVYDEYKEHGNINTLTNSKTLCKVFRNHLNRENIAKVLQKPACTEKSKLEDISDIDFQEKDNSTGGVEDNEISRNVNASSPKEMDSGNVSPESLQLGSFRDDSRLSNLTPTIAYTPETFLIEHEEHDSDNFD